MSLVSVFSVQQNKRFAFRATLTECGFSFWVGLGKALGRCKYLGDGGQTCNFECVLGFGLRTGKFKRVFTLVLVTIEQLVTSREGERKWQNEKDMSNMHHAVYSAYFFEIYVYVPYFFEI